MSETKNNSQNCTGHLAEIAPPNDHHDNNIEFELFINNQSEDERLVTPRLARVDNYSKPESLQDLSLLPENFQNNS